MDMMLSFAMLSSFGPRTISTGDGNAQVTGTVIRNFDTGCGWRDSCCNVIRVVVVLVAIVMMAG